MSETQNRPPVLFLSHGAPPLADDKIWTDQLHSWSADLPRPKNILVVSAHWEQDPTTVSAYSHQVPLVYDFWGFPEKYFQVTYDSPVAPELARSVNQLAATTDNPIHHDETRGLDHGAYVPLVELFPEADIPVLQMSMNTLDPQTLFDLGRKLAPLRDEGTMIIGSGFTTHNMSWFNPRNPAYAEPPTASSEFDHWATEAMARGDVDAILNYETLAPAAAVAHPRTEHWAPLYVALGAAEASGGIESRSVIDGFWYGLSKRSWQIG